jgi:hypothetical protein
MSRFESKFAPMRRAAVSPEPQQGGDHVGAVIEECWQHGLLEELRAALAVDPQAEQNSTLRVVRDLVYELAGAQNRDLAVDVLIYATGIGEFDLVGLRAYARRHGLTPEGFRKQVVAMQRRLGLPPRLRQNHDAN